jgi:hypothetical protein
MTRIEYVERVLSVMRHATPTEREAIRAEIDAHIEDHICDLMELDYDEALAEERTMARMGDPEEVGRELDKQYPVVWLVVKRVAMVLALVLSLMLLARVEWNCVKTNLAYQFYPPLVMNNEGTVYEFLDDHPENIRVTSGNSVIRVSAVAIYKMGPGRPLYHMATLPENPLNIDSENQYVAAVEICGYPASWLDVAREPYCPWVSVRGASDAWFTTGGPSSYIVLIPVEPWETKLTATYQGYGHDLSFTIPLDWEVVE